IDIQWGHWGIEGLNGNSICWPLLTNDERKVNNLWDQDQKRWKRDRVIELYGKEIGDCICNLPIPPNGFKDRRTWLQNLHGVYTMKLAYSWLSLKRIGFGPHKLFWRIIWKLKMLPKIKVFNWRIDHDILPTYINIARIRQNFSTTCPRCKNSDETLLHTLKECSKVRETLIIRGKDDPAMVVWDRVQTLSKDFRIFNLNEPPMIPPTPVCKGWKKPLNDFIKINVYAVVLNGYVGYGDIARDTDGFVLAGCYGFAIRALDVIWAELEALTMGLNLASKLNAPKLIMESDNATLINTIKKRDQDVTILGRCVKKECMALRNFELVHFN
ncbi:hypothetical protein Godav_021184, partial [Gossypium davidsonii]|nr:hypothetical protein [Gossypium davidsonii]MBA0644098.1 hypothetical protein [Gossypium klotzschianum]